MLKRIALAIGLFPTSPSRHDGVKLLNKVINDTMSATLITSMVARVIVRRLTIVLAAGRDTWRNLSSNPGLVATLQ